MNDSKRWLEHYDRRCQHRINRALHGICAPLFVIGLIGLLWSAPAPAEWQRSSDVLNWGTIFLMATLVYYFIISFVLAMTSLPFIVAIVALIAWMETLPLPLWLISSCLFGLAWSGQALGHWIESGRARFLGDLQSIMIGPLWLLAALFRLMRVPY